MHFHFSSVLLKTIRLGFSTIFCPLSYFRTFSFTGAFPAPLILIDFLPIVADISCDSPLPYGCTFSSVVLLSPLLARVRLVADPTRMVRVLTSDPSYTLARIS